MIRLQGKFRDRVSNRSAMLAAVLLALTALFSLQSSDKLSDQEIAGNRTVASTTAESSSASSDSSTKLNLGLLLFRHD